MAPTVTRDLVARDISIRPKTSTFPAECDGQLHHINDPLGDPAPATHALLLDVGRLQLVIWLCDACAERAREEVDL